MFFFDQIGKKATEMYQGVKDKTTQISSELKLKSKITDEKDKISKTYSEIGKLVFEEYTKNSSDFSNEVANKCREIIASKEAIENLNKEIMSLKDVIVCPKCGETIGKDSDFCPKCGNAIAKEGKVIESKEENKAE